MKRCPTGTWSSPSSRARTQRTSSRDAPVVAEGSFYSQHEPHLPIEPETLQAYWGTDGMMTIQCKCQSFTENRDFISGACGIPKDNIRMQLNAVGGSFGYTVSPNTNALLVTAVQNLDMPCSLTTELRRVQPHHGQEIRRLFQWPHRLRHGGQDLGRRVRHRARSWGLCPGGRPHLRYAVLHRLPRLQHPQPQGPGPCRLHQPRLHHRLPRLWFSPDLHHE